MAVDNKTIETVEKATKDYKYGFVTEVETEFAPKGLNEDIVKFISDKNDEPEWLLEWRLDSYKKWLNMKNDNPKWANIHFPEIDFQDAYYYAAPKTDADKPKSLDEIDPEILETYNKLGIPLKEQEMLAGIAGSENIAVDAVFDSVSVATTFKSKLAELGIVFCPISEAIKTHPDLIKKYMGSVVPQTDNFYAALKFSRLF